MEPTANRIVVRGNLCALPEFSHENHNRKFYRFFLEVPRLSGAVDTLPVITESRILNEIDLSGGQLLTVTGEIRSHNIRENGRRRLLIFIFASAIRSTDEPPCNDAVLEGAGSLYTDGRLWDGKSATSCLPFPVPSAGPIISPASSGAVPRRRVPNAIPEM